MATQQLESLIQRLEKVTTRLESVQTVGGAKGGSSSGSTSAPTEQVAPRVTAYDEYVDNFVKPFLAVSRDIGGDLNNLAELVETGFNNLKQLVVVGTKSKKPKDDDLPELLKPLGETLTKVTNLKDSKRGADYYNHLFAADEGLKCLQWPAVGNTPVAYVKEMVNAAQFYNNKVLVAYRQKDPRHVDFVAKFKQMIEELAAYVKEHHTTGLAWNAQGGDWKTVQQSSSSSTTAPPPSSGGSGGPPPPPPGPPPKFDDDEPPKGGKTAPTGDLFAAINAKRDQAGAGLRKVAKEEKTKYRKDEDKVSVVPLEIQKKGVTTAPSTAGKKKSGPPKLELQQGMGEKWVVENFEKKHDIVIEKTMSKQGIYIFNCVDCLITVKGKVNNIILDSCKKTGVIFDDVVSSVELVNSASVKVQVNGKVPTINVDKTDGVQIFLSKDSIDTTIITSKSSEMNVCVPEGDDYTEMAIPEQFQSKYNVATKKLDTEMVSLNL